MAVIKRNHFVENLVLKRQFFENCGVFGGDGPEPYFHVFDSLGNVVGREPVGAYQLAGYQEAWSSEWGRICREREEAAEIEERYFRKREELREARDKRAKRAAAKKELNEAKMAAAAAHLKKTAWIHF